MWRNILFLSGLHVEVNTSRSYHNINMRSPVEGATPAQVGTPTQAGMLLQRRLVCYPNADWYVTSVRKAGESAKLLMIYIFVKINKTMVEVYKNVEADCS
jgi:hypothetical protein